MATTDAQNRRSSDNIVNRLTKYLALVGIISSLVVAGGSLIWAKKDDVDIRCIQLENRINGTEKDAIEIKTDIKYIVKMLESAQRENRR